MPHKNPSPAPRLNSQTHVPNLDRALTILEYMAQGQTSGVSEIAEELTIPKNTVFRILNTLSERGYLEKDPTTKRYKMGTKMLSLGYSAVHEAHLVEKSMDVLRQIRDETNETTLVGILDNTQGVVLEVIPSSNRVKVVVGVGERFPLHTSAPGKAMLAYLPEAQLDETLEKMTLTRFNERTITTRQGMRAEIDKIRRIGYATDIAEEIEALHCISAVVVDRNTRTVGAIWITGPSFRMPLENFEQLATIIIAGARRVSQRFGYHGAWPPPLPTAANPRGNNGKVE
jgi:DNA-binding IclR family transcriptional regulator